MHRSIVSQPLARKILREFTLGNILHCVWRGQWTTGETTIVLSLVQESMSLCGSLCNYLPSYDECILQLCMFSTTCCTAISGVMIVERLFMIVVAFRCVRNFDFDF